MDTGFLGAAGRKLRASHPQLLLVALLALTQYAVLDVHACTSAMYADPATKQVVSWRHLDLPASYFNQIAWVPKGMQLRMVPVANNASNLTYPPSGPSYAARYSFVCFTATRAVISAWIDELAPGANLTKGNTPGMCSDGINTAGLGVSGLMQFSSTGINEYKGSGPAVEQVDFITYMLATYSTVAGVKAALEAGQLNPVLNPSLSPITRAMFGTNYSTLHYVLYDVHNKSLVIEYSGPKNLQWYDNELGALANNPLYEEQVAYYKAWVNYSASQASVTMHNSSYYAMPGGFNSSERFTKAVMLKHPAAIWDWPKDIAISPWFVAPGLPAANPSLMANIDMAANLFLPKGVDDSGGIQIAGASTLRDATFWTSIRDHANKVYYYKVANAPIWKRISLSKVPWSKLGGIKYADMEPTVWWQDKSYDKA